MTPRDLQPVPATGDDVSLAEAHRSIALPGRSSGLLRRFGAFAGPGYLVAVGYMDPGNWATDLAGGSAYGYSLLWTILLANLMAMLLQALTAKLGIATGRDLAQACRDQYSKPVAFALWLVCEAAIVACDLAEVIGSAIALQLLFGIPLVLGVVLTALDVLLLLALQRRGFRQLEAFVITLLIVIAGCIAYEVAVSQPQLGPMLRGFVPTTQIVQDPAMLYIAIGIIGATVMPHNLYLHSAAVQTRAFDTSTPGKRAAVRFAVFDSSLALLLALFVNAGILILAASAFHASGQTGVAEIQEAFKLLSPTVGAAAASTLFAVALLASGQSSTLTATLAGQVVMEGFLGLKLAPWVRRLLTRGLAIIPAVVVAALYGESGTARLLVLSQVVLSLQLPFAIVPLIQFTSNRKQMGALVNSRLLTVAATACAVLIIGLNLRLLASFVTGG
ncbi:Nramp family divalent metal transporter [Sphingomonas sp. KRR8]|uniref:Nramp family divalent metal transporter n=1 Tax=Sphingomonas sp. KRR8 TaxID=2942996 RepID=UPI00202074D3|nr:Nramp family divalent metal transporter [Sphingomonas sp. KRR8]URD59734.1 Nramp family divalent metal transporter [Sphingomonas sp. KRR8]